MLHAPLSRWSIFLLLAGCLLGCEIPAQMSFSPDGRYIAYFKRDRMHLLAADGRPMALLGESLGGMVWTRDSKTLYFAADRSEMPATAPATTAAMAPEASGSDQVDGTGEMMLYCWRDGDVEPLAPLPHPVLHLAIDPSEQWLAIVMLESGEAQNRRHLYAFHIPGRALHSISDTNGLPACFTGDGRLAFVEAYDEHAREALGAVVEIKLDELPNQPQRKRLLNVLVAGAGWMQSINGDLLLTALPLTLPGPYTEDLRHTLFHYTRASKNVAPIATDVGQFFSISPEGTHLLFEKITRATESAPERRALCIANINGSDAHELRDLGQYESLPMFPAWRGQSEIAFVPPVKPDQPVGEDGRLRFEVTLYRISVNGSASLEFQSRLSQHWPDEMKPSARAHRPSTRPATDAAGSGDVRSAASPPATGPLQSK